LFQKSDPQASSLNDREDIHFYAAVKCAALRKAILQEVRAILDKEKNNRWKVQWAD